MQVPPVRASRALMATALLLALAGCGGDGDSTAPQNPGAIELATGGAQTGAAGAELAEPIGVKVTSAAGEPLPGITVNFSAATNGARLSAASARTNASGIASVVWTLGIKAGADVDTLRATADQLPGDTAVVTASATAAAPSALQALSGDAQTGDPGEPAAEPLVVVVHDTFGNPNRGIVVSWTAEGGGTLSAAKDTTDAAGQASVVWTLGPGDNKANATIEELEGARATFTASLTVSDLVKLLSVSPNPIVEGESATLTGSGFSATASANNVWVDGIPAVVTAATETSLQITVPTFDCKPSRTVPVRVAVGSDGSNVIEHPLDIAAAPLAIAPGEQVILRDPADYCLQFAASAGPTAYLVGAQSVSDAVTSVTPVKLRAIAGSADVLALSASSLPAPTRMVAPRGAGAQLLVAPAVERWKRHREAEARLRARERRIMGTRLGSGVAALRASPTVSAVSIPADAQVGDTVVVNFPDLNSPDFCSTSIPIQTVVRANGAKGIWLEDVANPPGGYETIDFIELSNLFDTEIYATDVAYFGEPTDIDGNGKVVIVTTKEVNKVTNTLGFVVSSDLFGDCTSSNGGEFYYGRAPDAAGVYEQPAPYSLDDAKLDAQILIAHEFTHVIQIGRRATFPGATAFQTTWEAEGQATFAQEVVGHAINGRSPGNNYGGAVAFNVSGSSEVSWYVPMFTDMAVYYGFEGEDSQAQNAPEQCSWLGRADEGNTGPCLSGREVYGVPALFLRWLSDQFGPSFPGGEQGLQRALIDNAFSGFATIEDVVNVPMDSLLAQWAAALYVDDRLSFVSPPLRFNSWDLDNIYSGLRPTAQLVPRERAFQSFTDDISVRGGSTGYFRISGAATPATAVSLRDALGDPLPSSSTMRLWVVRLQ